MNTPLTSASLTLLTVKAVLESAEENLTKFSQSLLNDPVYALEWAEVAYEAAARQKVCRSVLDRHAALLAEHADEGEALDMIREDLTRELLQDCRHIPASSSTSANLMALHLRAAKASIIEQLSR